MKSFFKYLLATVVGILVSFVILFLIFAAIVGSVISSGKKQMKITPHSILQINLNKPIPDRSSTNPFENISLMHLKPSFYLGLNDIVNDIRYAKNDPDIRGIYLNTGTLRTGLGSLEEIRNALLDFKSSGKFILSYANYYSHGSYYLASVADSIYLNPQGELDFLGLHSEIVFYKGLLDKLGIEPEVIRHGKYKSFVEPYTKEHMSDANRLQINELLKSVWDHMLTGISTERHISIPLLNRYADNMTIRSAKAAVEYKLIDGVRYKDEILASLTKLSGVSSVKDLKLVSLSDYNKVPKMRKGFPSDKIAVIYASGDIDMGSGTASSIGSESFSAMIRQVRQDKNIKAIVLRVNSPGGSAQASDIIWRELSLAEKAKPLIVSMGSVAASGGYYISSPADTIVADPTTITGSIGVFGMFFNAKNFFNKKLGITDDIAETNKHSDLGAITSGWTFRPLEPEEKDVIRHEVENIYNVFLTRVSQGRKMSKAAVDSIAQGRVWSAIDAKKIGLVDVIGGLNDAIAIAAKKAHLHEYRIEELPKPEDKYEALLNDLSAKIKENSLKSELGDQYKIFENVNQILKFQGIQTRLPYQLQIY